VARWVNVNGQRSTVDGQRSTVVLSRRLLLAADAF
jgi:hypothetical protein